MRATVTETAKTIRKELKEGFPGTKFSVRSSKFAGGDAIDISWELGPTTKMVDEVVSKYKDGHFDSMVDEYKRAKDGRPGGAKYVDTSRSIPDEIRNEVKQFLESEGIDLRKEDTLVHQLFGKADLTSGYKGVRQTNWTCGSMHEFYEIVTGDNEHESPSSPPAPVCHRCEKEIPGGELKLYCEPCEAEMSRMDEERRAKEALAKAVTPEITEVEGDVRITVVMPRLNKQDTIERVDQQIFEDSDEEQARITHVARFTDADYALFTRNLMLGYDWLDGKGGPSSDYEPPFEMEEGRDAILELHKRGLMDEWRAQAYIHCVLCENESGDQLVVDPEGYSYARYAGRPKEPVRDLVPAPEPEEETVTKPDLKPHHDISRFCGSHKTLAIDHIKYDADRKALVASNGILFVLAPCEMGDEPVLIPQPFCVDGENPHGLLGAELMNGHKFPDPAIIPTPTPAGMVHLSAEHLRVLVDYANEHGYTCLSLMLDAQNGATSQATPVKFALSNAEDSAQVVGAIQPLESDGDTDRQIVRSVTKTIAIQATTDTDTPATVPIRKPEPKTKTAARKGTRLADVKPAPFSEHGRTLLKRLPASDRNRVKLLAKSKAAILVELSQEENGDLAPGKAASRFARFQKVMDNIDEGKREIAEQILGVDELRGKLQDN